MDNNANLYNPWYEIIASYFDLEELKNLCFDLQVEFENLPGEATRIGRARELVRLMERQERTAGLLTRLQMLRPQVEWQRYLPAEPEAIAPYKGLRFFDEADAPLFFGREQLTAELVDHLRQHRFLAVVGASGSVKSSIVRAGVIPAVRGGAIADDSGNSAGWPIHVITPGDEPLKALAVSLTRHSESVTAAQTLLADLRASSDSLDLFLYRAVGNGRLLLVVDQFEELFTQCDDATARLCDAASGAERLSLNHGGWVLSAAWNEDESLILTWGGGRTARVWEAASGAERLSLNHENTVRGATWNGDESLILTWSDDGTARLWKAATGAAVFTLMGDGSRVVTAKWRRVERPILLVTKDGFAGIFDTQMADLLDAACQRTTRNFTWQEWQSYFPDRPYRHICAQWPAHRSLPAAQRP